MSQPGLDIPKQPPAVVISTVRTITPILVTVVAGLLAKAHIVAVDNTTLSTGIDWALGGLVGLAWTFGVRLLETRVAPWWGRLFLLPKAPSYSPGVGPQEAPTIVAAPTDTSPAVATVPASVYVPKHIPAPTGGAQ